MSANTPQPQLMMVWPRNKLKKALRVKIPAGYRLRSFQEGDQPHFYELMVRAGFPDWGNEKQNNLANMFFPKILPQGWFFVFHKKTGIMTATAMSTHNPRPGFFFGGELSWVGGDPEHGGKGLGLAVCAAVVNRYLKIGYQNIYLLTDDHRLPAIKVYLKLGFLPNLVNSEMEERWKTVCQKLNWPFTPQRWLRISGS